MGGTTKGLQTRSVPLSLFLRVKSNYSARIPLPALRATLSPGEGLSGAPAPVC